MDKFLYTKFSNINLEDEFFDSLKNDYSEFENWFNRKARKNESTYVQTIDDKIEGFLYLKIEAGPILDVTPKIECKQAVKIGTMKINPHGTRLGERFIKKSLDFAINNNIDTIYVTVFAKHEALIQIYLKYGFVKFASKTSPNGTECVLVKNLNINTNFYHNYPKISATSNSYILSVFPKYHTNLFPDSILATENFNIVEDISHTNSIEKIYICRMPGVSILQPGDNLIIYRTTDIPGQALYRAVATSICTATQVKSSKDFSSLNEFKHFCKNYSIFSDSELTDIYNSTREHFVIKMLYNVALPKRLIRKHLINSIGIDASQYWGFFSITSNQFNSILKDSNVNSGYII